MRFIVDLDGVVIDLVPEILKRVNVRWRPAFDVLEQDIYVHQVEIVLGVSRVELKDIIEESILQGGAAPVPGALFAITQLREWGNTVHFITSRKLREPAILTATLLWLDSHGFLTPDKAPPFWFDAFQANPFIVDIAIDDSIPKLVQFGKSANTLVLFNRPWNIQCLDVKRCFRRVQDWGAVLNLAKQE